MGQGQSSAGVFDRSVALLVVLCAHLLLYRLLSQRPPAAPEPGVDTALALVFVLRPSRDTPTPTPAARVATPRAESRPNRADPSPRITAAPPHDSAPALDTSLASTRPSTTTAVDVWSNPSGHAGDVGTDFRRDPLGARRVDLVAVPPRHRFRMRAPRSPKAFLAAVAKMTAGAGYHADLCPELQDEIDTLLSDAAPAAREQLSLALQTQRSLCR